MRGSITPTTTPQHAELILAVWDRAEYYLALTASLRNLGRRDATIRTWVYDPENLAEITMLREG